MSRFRLQARTGGFVAAISLLLLLLVYVAVRSGPFAAVPVTVAKVGTGEMVPSMFGIGTVQARYVYKIGPAYAGRVKSLNVDVGDTVAAGELLGEMDPVDLDARIEARAAAIKAAVAARRQAEAGRAFARAQMDRYEKLLAGDGTSEEVVAIKRQEAAVADAALMAAEEEVGRLRAEESALRMQRADLRLVAPAGGLVVARNMEPGSTAMAGQTVLEVVDPGHLWIDARFDQAGADGLEAGLPAQIVLRSKRLLNLKGHVLRVEPLADAVTEETLAKIVFEEVPVPLPPLGELAEVTVQAGRLPSGVTIPNAAIRRADGRSGVWVLKGARDRLHFAPVAFGRTDLEGRVQVMQGLSEGDLVIVHSEGEIRANTRIRVVRRLVRGEP